MISILILLIINIVLTFRLFEIISNKQISTKEFNQILVFKILLYVAIVGIVGLNIYLIPN